MQWYSTCVECRRLKFPPQPPPVEGGGNYRASDAKELSPEYGIVISQSRSYELEMDNVLNNLRKLPFLFVSWKMSLAVAGSSSESKTLTWKPPLPTGRQRKEWIRNSCKAQIYICHHRKESVVGKPVLGWLPPAQVHLPISLTNCIRIIYLKWIWNCGPWLHLVSTIQQLHVPERNKAQRKKSKQLLHGWNPFQEPIRSKEEA